MLSPCFHTGPVTALACVGRAILAGVGSRLHVYNLQPTPQHVGIYHILPGRVIHGIRQDSQTECDESQFCVFGQKCLRVIQFDQRSLEVKVSMNMVEFNDWIWDVAWLQGGENLALALGHNVIVTWNIVERKIISTTHCAEKCILYCARFLTQTEDPLVLAVGTVFNQVVLWSPNSEPDDQGHRVPFHRLPGHQGVIFSVCYDPVSQKICSVSDDRSIRLYQVTFPHTDNDGSLETWQSMETSLIYVLYGHTARVWDVRLLSRVLVSVGEDATCCVWNYDGKVLQKFKGHKGKSIWSMAADRMEQFVVTGGGDSSIRLWYLHPEEIDNIVTTRTLDLQTHSEDFPRTVQFLSEKLVLAMTNEGFLLLIEIDPQNTRCLMKDDTFASYSLMSVLPGRQMVAIGNIHGTLKILLMNDSLHDIVVVSDSKIYSGRITSMMWLDTDHILTSGLEGKMNIWRLPDHKVADRVLQSLASFELPVSKHRWATAAALSQDMSYLICGDKAGSVLLYNMDGRLIQMFPKIHKPEVTNVCLHGNQVYTAGRDGIYRLYDRGENELVLLNSSKVFKGFVWIERVTVTDERDILIQGFNANKFVLWSVQQNQKLIEVESGGGHRSWDFLYKGYHGDRSRLVFIKAREVIVKDILSQSCQLIVKGCLHGREVCDVKYITSTWDSSGKPVHLVATCSEDTMVSLSLMYYNDHNQQDFHILHSLSGHISSVRCLALCESSVPSSHNSRVNRKLLFSAGGRAQVKIWRLDIDYKDNLKTDSKSDFSKSKTGLSKTPAQNVQATCLDQENKDAAYSSVTNDIDCDPKAKHACQNFSKCVRPDTAWSTSTEGSRGILRKQNVHDGNETNRHIHTCEGCVHRESDLKQQNYNTPVSHIPLLCQYESIAGVLLGTHKKRKVRPWRVKEDNSDPETRILDLTVFRAIDISPQYPESLYFLTLACSDGVIRLFLFEEDSREVTFISASNFHDHCILKVCHVIHKCEHRTSTLIVSAATDGKVAFWDITDLCQSVISSVLADENREQNKETSDVSVFLEKRIQSQHAQCKSRSGSSLSSRTENNIDNRDSQDETEDNKDPQQENEDWRSELVPAGWLQCHQSGVNSVYFGRYKDLDTYILITGGDDNALHVSMVPVGELVTSSTGSASKVKVIGTVREVSAHAAQITGIWFLDSDLIVTASIDQRVCIWSITVQDSKIKLKFKDCRYVDVPDVANIDVWKQGEKVFMAACGVGLEILEIDYNSDEGT